MMTVEEALASIEAADCVASLEQVRLMLVGKKGVLGEAMKGLSALSPDEKRSRGEVLNAWRDQVQGSLQEKKRVLSEALMNQRLTAERMDTTLPPPEDWAGRLHPLTVTQWELIRIFESMGFQVVEGPHIEDDFHNFTALNIPPHHPARSPQDTFYLPGGSVLRTHTSNVEVRQLCRQAQVLRQHLQAGKSLQDTLEGGELLRVISLGRVFRSDDDATHTPMFHQIEGLVVGRNLHMGHLIGCLQTFLSQFFGCHVPIRLRPSFFPFTEPSAEVDIRCARQGHRLVIGEGQEWMEILGCGMSHRNVLRNCGIDPTCFQAFAFGVGIERLTMLKQGIGDLRRFYENDSRFRAHYGKTLPRMILG